MDGRKWPDTPNGPPNKPPPGPPIPPPKNCLKSSSGDISSSNIEEPPGVPALADRAKLLNGDEGPAPVPNLLSGSPPNLSYFDFLSGSDRT